MPEIKEDDFLIENQDLIGAINASLARGETLKDAMMALYNSGYEKTKIEEAAKAYIALSKNPDKSNELKTAISATPIKNEIKKEKVKKVGILDKALAARAVSSGAITGGGATSEVTQHVSQYEAKQKAKPKVQNNSNLVTFLLIFLLVFLLLILGAVFLFKEELVDFFNRLFA